MTTVLPSTKTDFKALLLEDYQSDAELIEYYLKESYPNCTLTHVTNEQDFLDSITAETPDIILSDLNLPHYSAFEAHSVVQKSLLGVPFIIVSGDITEGQAERLIQKGIDDYLLKSSLTRIGMAVGQALQRTNSLNQLKSNDQVIESNLDFINSILDHSGIAICEVEIPLKSAIFSKKFDKQISLKIIQEFFTKIQICRVNHKVLELFEFKSFDHFANNFIDIFDESNLQEVIKIMMETHENKIVQNKRLRLKSFKGHKRHINLNLISKKQGNSISIITSFLDETSRLESESRTEKLLERMEKTIFERTKQLKVVNEKLNEQAEHTARINKVLEYNFNQTTDSIQAAKKIQKLMLPKISQIKNAFSDAFVFYKAKDIVSGDFYWFHETATSIWISAADCTGHGVPGALMAMTGAHLLSEIVNSHSDKKPNDILTLLDDRIIDRLKQRESGNAVSTGMDISLCKFEKGTFNLEFSGAYQDLFIKKNGVITSLKGDRRGVGGTHEYKDKEFTCQKGKLEKGNKIYFSSDGMPDQFGGETGKKLMKKRFIAILENFKREDMNGELLEIKNAYHNWKGKEDQVDDIIVMGLEI